MDTQTAQQNLYRETMRSIREKYCTDNQACTPETTPVSMLVDQYPNNEELYFNH